MLSITWFHQDSYLITYCTKLSVGLVLYNANCKNISRGHLSTNEVYAPDCSNEIVSTEIAQNQTISSLLQTDKNERVNLQSRAVHCTPSDPREKSSFGKGKQLRLLLGIHQYHVHQSCKFKHRWLCKFTSQIQMKPQFDRKTKRWYLYNISYDILELITFE